MKYRRLLGDLLPADRLRRTYAELIALEPTLDVRALVSALPALDIGAPPPARVTA